MRALLLTALAAAVLGVLAAPSADAVPPGCYTDDQATAANGCTVGVGAGDGDCYQLAEDRGACASGGRLYAPFAAQVWAITRQITIHVGLDDLQKALGKKKAPVLLDGETRLRRLPAMPRQAVSGFVQNAAKRGKKKGTAYVKRKLMREHIDDIGDEVRRRTRRAVKACLVAGASVYLVESVETPKPARKKRLKHAVNACIYAGIGSFFLP